MRKRKKKYIKYKKERVILSDVLPFEVPITFSNRNFYDFLLSCKIAVEGEKIAIGKNDTPTNQEIVKLLFGINKDKPFSNGKVNFEEDKRDAIPFGYKIVHKENDFRELTIIHPKNQLAVIDFYDRYRDLILYYSNKSQFSIRRPHRIAKYTYFKDRLHIEKLAEDNDEIVEQNDLEYENLKTFFVYKKYSNIHKFYESYQYHRCEKKFNYLFKFDISKCFDSIYTHSISWALLDKEVVKKYLGDSKQTFGHRFDTLMQKLNYNETNGIVIGPEFSRIFAELILQEIDERAKQELKLAGFHYKKDYEIFRYVDDYFVFYNDETTKDKILTTFRLGLRDFKLSLNDSKTIQYKKPIITEITIAKQKINDLLNTISYKIEDFEDGLEEDGITPIKKKKGKIYIDSNSLITKFKTIIFEAKIDYKDILNYTFSIIERKLNSLVKNYFKIIDEKNTEKNFINALLELLDFVFFLYSVSPRVNTTIKLCRILRIVTATLNYKDEFNLDFKHLLFKKIYDNIVFTLHKNKTVKHTQVETLYLLIALGELGNKYWLTEDVLASYLCIKVDEKTKDFYSDTELNYFSIVVSLFYMKDKIRFKKLRDFILQRLVDKFENVDYGDRIKKAELILLLFDIIAYPFVNIDTIKRKLLTLYKITDVDLQTNIINARNNWFTDWSEFDFGKALDAKQSQEVY
ncbi:MAG: RNA-directed DNA polymerase [Bacteroidetes bacterium]|nr:RNA-directed DNA polymerase [Bacteroidota bacterium]